MEYHERKAAAWVQAFLPEGAELILHEPAGQQMVVAAAYDVYPYYFPGVVRYYERLVERQSSYSFYRKHLQEACSKARWFEAGISDATGELIGRSGSIPQL